MATMGSLEKEKCLGLDQNNSTISRQFYIFGKGISFSLSPMIHNTGFKIHGLNYHYSIHEVDKIEECEPFIRNASFGGASVTMPYKLHISKLCDLVTEDAKIIGAINTLNVKEVNGKRLLEGGNTDWSGLVSCIRERLPEKTTNPEVGWVIGAGGASRAAVYALYKAGIRKICISNRTKSHATKIALDYSSLFHVDVIENWEDMNDHPADIIIGTIPADTVTEEQFANIEWKRSGGLCIDMSYKPRLTPLLKIAQSQEGWSTANGVDVLLEQGFTQYKIWTGLDAPKDIVKQAVV